MRRNVSRRVITSTDEFLDASPTGGILPILVRPGAIHARLTSARIVRTCEDYARKWRYQDVTLAGLCEASGGQSGESAPPSMSATRYRPPPTAYLRVAALNAVRRELVEGPRLRNAVSHAATAWGFWHLSRFAALRSARY